MIEVTRADKRKVFGQGRRAAEAQVPAEDCPFWAIEDFKAAWLRGWKAAKENAAA